jgi:hypothetical protein
MPNPDNTPSDNEMDAWVEENYKHQKELLSKLSVGQRVKLENENGEPELVGSINKIYTDFNYGSFTSVFVDLILDDGSVIERVLAEDISF